MIRLSKKFSALCILLSVVSSNAAAQTYSTKQIELIEENEQAIINEVYISRLFRKLMTDYENPNWIYLDLFMGKGPEISANNFFDWENIFFGYQVYAFSRGYNESGETEGDAENAGYNMFIGYTAYLNETKIFTGIYFTVNGRRRSEEEIKDYEESDDEDFSYLMDYLSPYFFIKNPLVEGINTTMDAVFKPGDDKWLSRFGAALILDMAELLDIRGLETGTKYDTVRIFYGWQHDFSAFAKMPFRELGIYELGSDSHAMVKYGYIKNSVDKENPVVEDNNWDSDYILVEGVEENFFGGISYREDAGFGFQAGAKGGVDDALSIKFSLQYNYVYESLYGAKMNPFSFFFSMDTRWD